MPRTIPVALQEHLDGDATTTCTLLRVDPVMPGIPSYGAALLDQPVTYDDGNGELVYQAIIGAQPSAIIYSSDLSIDGGNATNLLPEFDFPISEADIMAGAYDFAEYTLYLVNYADLSQGHVLLSRGTLGRFYVNNDGLSFTHEMRSLAQALKQSITEKWSIGCRATFGSQAAADSNTGRIVERFPCNYPADDLWEPGTVVAVGLENNQSFTPTALSPPFGGNPGKVRWLTGANAGRENEVDQFDSGGIGLTFPTAYPIQVGDTFLFRDDCPKTPEACKVRDNWENYRGEPNIPVGDAGQIAVPGASAGIGTGGRLTVGTDDPV